MTERGEIRRQLGLGTAVALVVGQVTGVGSFLTPAGMAKSLGSPFSVLAIWLISGATALAGALSLGELADRYPAAGGLYVYLRQAYGPCIHHAFTKEATMSDPVRPPLLEDGACRRRMPEAAHGAGQPLPNWAMSVAVHLPRTAAAMLELDLAQRTRSPLDPALRARMRWVVARANRCSYSEAYALADLAWAGADAVAVKALTEGPAAWPEMDREPLEFVRLLTEAAPTIADDLFARLRTRFGDKQVAAMVLLAAYGNFQDRLILGLGLPLEKGGPLRPLDVKFAPGAFQPVPVLPPARELPELLESGATVVPLAPGWSTVSYEELQARMEGQRGRTPRLPVPGWDEVSRNLPAGLAAHPTRIVWTLVCWGHVPELAVPWSVTTRTMGAESGQDRVFEESLFWVQTRAVRCNYCMGHTEMLLEVAGLSKEAIAQRVRCLGGDDWSGFPPAEQRAYAFARKLSLTPWELSPADYRDLEADLGPAQALFTFWWLCRGLYMTRISDGFQLPLERDNVFRDYFPRGAVAPPAARPVELQEGKS